ncbi:MAG: hypothetical protein RLZZ127_910 [Planctomycetota bacterium]|jgi:putative ABC transport system permease protein
MMRIALLMLTADRGRFIGIVTGVTFAALLITQQMSIFLGLLGRAGAPVQDVRQAQVWVMDPSQDAVDLDGVRPMGSTALWRVRGSEGVAWAAEHLRVPIAVALGDGARRSAMLVGIDADAWIGAPPTLVQGSWEDLRRADAVIVDEDGATKLWRPGPDGARRHLAVGDEVEINDHRAVVVGVARSTRAIFFAPPLWTTVERAKTWIPPQRRDVSYIVAGVAPGHDPAAVARGIARRTGLRAVTAPEFGADSSAFFAANTGVPINFGIAVVLGFLVGVAVAGLLFLQFVRENLRYLGALKAMGAENGVLVRMTVLQAVVVGAIGYGLGIGLAALMGHLAGGGTRTLAWDMPPWLLLGTGVAVLLIVLVAALLGVRRVVTLEPAVVFRG